MLFIRIRKKRAFKSEVIQIIYRDYPIGCQSKICFLANFALHPGAIGHRVKAK